MGPISPDPVTQCLSNALYPLWAILCAGISYLVGLAIGKHSNDKDQKK